MRITGTVTEREHQNCQNLQTFPNLLVAKLTETISSRDTSVVQARSTNKDPSL